MSSLIIDRKDITLAYGDGALKMRTPMGPIRSIPLRGVERIIIQGGATITSGLLAQCWERRISLLFLTGRRHEPSARFHGHPHNDASIRAAQVLACFSAPARSRLARRIVIAKLRRQRQCLDALAATRADGAHRAAPGRRALRRALQELAQGAPADTNRLRGIEGAAAAGYFRSYTRFFPPALGFTGRRRRPAPDPVNAALSLAYTIATFESGRAASIAGLDPAIGALHGLAHGRDALALDLVEPLRPLVDGFVHELFACRRLTGDHFRPQPDGAMFLGKAGRRHFYEAWEEYAPVIRRNARTAARLAVRWLRWEGEAAPAFRAGGP